MRAMTRLFHAIALAGSTALLAAPRKPRKTG